MPLPVPAEGFVASVEEVARRLGVHPATPAQAEVIEGQLWDAQGDVEGELNRPLLPTQHVLTEMEPWPGYEHTDARAWPGLLDRFDDVVTVVSAVAQPDGTYTLTVDVGLDAREVPAIRRYIVAAAVESARVNPDVALGGRRVTSVSADGQSVSYAAAQPEAGTAGAPPTMDALKRRYLKRSAFVRRLPESPPWPYYGSRRP